METTVMDSVSSHAASRAADRSPIKSPAKAARTAGGVVRGQDDVVSYQTSDQKTAVRPIQHSENVEKPNKYIQLLKVAYPLGGRSKISSSSEPSAPTTAASHSPVAGRQLASTAKSAGSNAADGVPSTRVSTSSNTAAGVAAKTTPLARASRSRASILDPSAGVSMIPASPGAAVSISPSPSNVAGKATTMQSDAPALARCSLPSPAPSASKPQYAFGSRIDAAGSARKPSPMRQSAPSAAADRSRASPQRVPSAAKVAIASGPTRSASAPRIANAEKVQSRFAVHQANALAEQRSKTPNPAARASAVAAAGLAGSRVRPAATMGTAAERHVARLRASQDGSSNKVPSPPAIRSASPSTAMRAAARSVPATAGMIGSTSRSSASGSASTSPLLRQSAGQRGSAVAASTTASRVGLGSVMGIPTIQDRYKNAYKHTPAAAAVAEARAAASAASAGTAASQGPSVPKLSLGDLLGAADSPVLLRTRQRDNDGSNVQQQRQVVPKLPLRGAADQHDHGSEAAASPFLGRVSAGAAASHPPTALHTPQQQRSLLPLHAAACSAAASTPAAAASPANSIANSEAYYTPMRGEDPVQTPEGKQLAMKVQEADEFLTPPLLHRELSSASGTGMAPAAELSQEGSYERLSRVSSKQLEAQSSVPCLSKEGSNLSLDSAVAVAAKGLVLPLHRLEAPPGAFSSPPRHRRGERCSPKGAAAVCSQLLKSKASSLCSAGSTATELSAATPSATYSEGHPEPSPPPAVQSPGKASRCTLGSMESAASVAAPMRLPALAHRSTGSIISSAEKPAVKSQAAAAAPGYVTPKATLKLAGAAGSAGKTAPSSSPGDKMRMTVPRLDLTPVLTLMDEDEEAEAAAQQQQAGQPLALEYYELGVPDSLTESEQQPQGAARSGQEGKPASAGSAARRGSSSSRGARAGSGNRKSSAPEQQPTPQESFYVYEAVMPAEETRTYEDLRRALLKCSGGQKLAANLQGLWGCYQDARKATEAMAFRGHRLLDQVSNEYCSYKRHAEEQLQQLQQERDMLQLALINDDGVGSGNLTHKDQQNLQQENDQLRLQLAEMNKAMQKAADYHFAQQADQVPVKARTIAESATTSILLQQTVAQQEELLKYKQELEDMKAALVIACGALKETNYMDPHGHVRATLQPDTVEVLDMMIQGTAAEVHMMEHSVAPAEAPHVHIEELNDGTN